MENRKLIGREEEQERLNRCMKADSAQLVIVYGRRRVGKTYLINQYFHNQFAFKLTGAYKEKRTSQLRNFRAEIRRKSGKDLPVPKDWIEAFEILRSYLETLPAARKQVVFLDEMPWLDTHKSGFLAAFEWFWNDWASTMDNLVFIVCGSATSWMVDHLANNKGGLFNRQTCRLCLKPFTLYETEQYLLSKSIHWSRYDIAECYMVMGGIPYYLSLLDSEKSYNQNIDDLFFGEKTELWDEFDHLYATLFTHGEHYVAVVEALSERRGGLTRSEVVEKTGFPDNGALTKILKNLTDSSFVRETSFYGNKKKDSLYQLADYYTWFYFRFLKGHQGKDHQFWSHSIDIPSRRAWAGLTFEQLCMDHTNQIKKKLGISGVLTEESSWFVRADEEKGKKGTQIDLLIDRRDHVINICEMKFSLDEYEISKSYDEVLRNKIETFRRETSCKKALWLTMITTYGVRRNKYSGIVQSQAILDDLFQP